MRRRSSSLGMLRGLTVWACLAAVAAVLLVAPSAPAQVFERSRSVGGVAIDTAGMLDNARIDDVGTLARLRAEALGAVPPVLNEAVPLRKVSLRRLEAAIAECRQSGRKLPDQIKYLAGLQSIRYVFVYPEQQDIVLVGPAEGWKVGPQGVIVGVHTGRPVMLLDDLLVAIRSANQAARGGITCSIDPTPEGLQRLRAHVSRLRTIGNPQATAAGIERALGMQQISVTGVPATTHFARVLVAADYRMKRIAMGFDRSPVAGLPSYLSMLPASGRGMSNMMPRWWLEPDYDALVRDSDGLAFELPAGSVKAMTEEDFLTAAGNKQHTGQANLLAQRWADLMTQKYQELAKVEPIFGQLQNCMELAVVSALIFKERLPEKVDWNMPVLLDGAQVAADEFPAPKQVASRATLMKKGRNWVITASGGVLINSWQLADRVKQGDSPQSARAAAASQSAESWWWN